ncbi:MAG: type III pantothenate kinase [Gammaproteobacteria bacterium]|nr:type III pantothenate kinase [Gammaproteobacteria bacterium]
MNNLYIDAGNSFFKIGIYNKMNEWIKTLSIKNQNLFNELEQVILETKKTQELNKIWIACVNQALDKTTLTKILTKFSRNIYFFKNDDYPFINSKYQSLQQLGVDRWLAILYPHFQQHKDYLIISCGTAITLDIVINHEHLGGHIIPGITTAMTSLKQKANLKSSLTKYENIYLPGINTSECIIQGVLSYTAAYINTMIENLNKQSTSEVSLWICGGDAELIASYLNYDYNLKTDMVLTSLNQIANLP